VEQLSRMLMRKLIAAGACLAYVLCVFWAMRHLPGHDHIAILAAQVPARLCLCLPVFHNGLASEK
jgi:hypothetical protein